MTYADGWGNAVGGYPSRYERRSAILLLHPPRRLFPISSSHTVESGVNPKTFRMKQDKGVDRPEEG